MTQLICTKKEFNGFLGPLIRNKVQYLTRSHKRKLHGKCQSGNCTSGHQELQAAHSKEKSRLDVINDILEKYTTSSVIAKIDDLDGVVKEIVNAHKPVKLNFIFLCQACHQEYDRK